MVLDNFFNSIFGFLLDWPPQHSLIFISFLLTLLITIAYKYLTDQKFLKKAKAELKELQKEIKELKHNPTRMMEKQKELMQKNMKLMGHSLKPSLFTLLPLIIIFSWLRSTYAPMGKILFGLSWIWVYIIFSIIFSLILRKILKVH